MIFLCYFIWVFISPFLNIRISFEIQKTKCREGEESRLVKQGKFVRSYCHFDGLVGATTTAIVGLNSVCPSPLIKT